MILMRILPGVLKELSRHVPTVLFQTLDWGELAHELPKLSRRILQKEGYQDLLNNYQNKLSALNIKLTQDRIHSSSFKGNKWVGEEILKLYFLQLYQEQGFFLDLRTLHFEIKDNEILWHPTSFWTQLNEQFRSGLIQVYEGFYLEDDELYYQGLTAIGLIQNGWPEEDRKELGDLFKSHFGSALHQEQKFNLDHFQESIVKMSEFMLNKKVKIPKDFLYVGVYLVGMYSALEEVDEALPVRDIFLEIRKLAK